MNKIITLCLLALAPLAHAKIIATPSKPIVAVDGSSIGKRVCYYQDQAYSIGSILQIGDHYLICKEQNDFETNGALMWHQLDSNEQTTNN